MHIRYTDAFGNETHLTFDPRDLLFLESSRDPRGNLTQVRDFDYRVLAPRLVEDINQNPAEVVHDSKELPIARLPRKSWMRGGGGRRGMIAFPRFAISRSPTCGGTF
jgi:hypothetical protein